MLRVSENTGDHETAIEYHHKALKVAQEQGDEKQERKEYQGLQKMLIAKSLSLKSQLHGPRNCQR